MEQKNLTSIEIGTYVEIQEGAHRVIGVVTEIDGDQVTYEIEPGWTGWGFADEMTAI